MASISLKFSALIFSNQLGLTLTEKYMCFSLNLRGFASLGEFQAQCIKHVLNFTPRVSQTEHILCPLSVYGAQADFSF